jgi:O-acetyl-ADP-ribose deacetylase (regulator of RNase III)
MFRSLYGGDIFASDARALVVPVNCVGVMGAGLARDFRARFPAVHQDYLSRCADWER